MTRFHLLEVKSHRQKLPGGATRESPAPSFPEPRVGLRVSLQTRCHQIAKGFRRSAWPIFNILHREHRPENATAQR